VSLPPPGSSPPGRPVLLTVDDDPSVSRSVARDLRRRYGRDYRVVRAESGADALAALREIKLRGDPVVALLADYRMPDMNGIDFLEHAMDLFPQARRALLTAYADTEAAIAAINVVDVDHYLLKPWDPPEEKLYPVLDQMIAAWRSSGDARRSEVRLVGHRWSAASHEVRDFLARGGVPYQWVPADEPEGRRLLTAADADDSAVPLLLTSDGAALRAPSLPQVAAKVGLNTVPQSDLYDVVIIGGGPAGLSAAVYAASEGLKTVLVEGGVVGGQAGQSSRIENYLGFPDGVSGGQLTDRARRQATRFGAEMLSATRVSHLEFRGSSSVVHTTDRQIVGHALVLATGVKYRRLPATGIDELTGRGVYYGSAAEGDDCSDQHVVIVGGANSAGQAAVHLSQTAARVTLAVRGPSIALSMSRYLTDRIEKIPNIDVRTCTEVSTCEGADRLERVILTDVSKNTSETVDASYLFAFIGAQPFTDWLPDRIHRDRGGFVLTGPDPTQEDGRPAGWPLPRDPYLLEASVPGVFAAGDVRASSVKRVASAVGEGALAVTLVHRYLEQQ
jgi:thioredoxin reductase (NADPH)